MPKYPLRTIADIRTANRASDHYFFQPSSLRLFSSKIGQRVWPQPDASALFCTSEQFTGSDGVRRPRKWTVRICWPDGRIDSLSDFGAFRSGDAAARWATKWTENAVNRYMAATAGEAPGADASTSAPS